MAYAPVPDANLSSSNTAQHLNQIHRVTRFLENLKPNTPFAGVCMKDNIPTGNGKTVAWTKMTNLGANTSTVPEGTVGTSIGLAPSKTLTATVSVYRDYTTTSDINLKTEGEGWFKRAVDGLSHRASLTVNNVTRAAIDAESSAVITLLGSFLGSKQFAAGAAVLKGQNVRGFQGGNFKAFIHPYNAFDVENDPSAGGLQDLYKYTNPEKLGAGVKTYANRGDLLGSIAGVDIFTSTSVLATSGTPNTWRGYLFGNESLGCSSLEGMSPTMVDDPSKQQFQIETWKTKGGSVANPDGSIGGGAFYRFTWVGGIALSGPTAIGGVYKYQMFDAPSSIVA